MTLGGVTTGVCTAGGGVALSAPPPSGGLAPAAGEALPGAEPAAAESPAEELPAALARPLATATTVPPASPACGIGGGEAEAGGIPATAVRGDDAACSDDGFAGLNDDCGDGEARAPAIRGDVWGRAATRARRVLSRGESTPEADRTVASPSSAAVGPPSGEPVRGAGNLPSWPEAVAASPESGAAGRTRSQAAHVAADAASAAQTMRDAKRRRMIRTTSRPSGRVSSPARRTLAPVGIGRRTRWLRRLVHGTPPQRATSR